MAVDIALLCYDCRFFLRLKLYASQAQGDLVLPTHPMAFEQEGLKDWQKNCTFGPIYCNVGLFARLNNSEMQQSVCFVKNTCLGTSVRALTEFVWRQNAVTRNPSTRKSTRTVKLETPKTVMLRTWFQMVRWEIMWLCDASNTEHNILQRIITLRSWVSIIIKRYSNHDNITSLRTRIIIIRLTLLIWGSSIGIWSRSICHSAFLIFCETKLRWHSET